MEVKQLKIKLVMLKKVSIAWLFLVAPLAALAGPPTAFDFADAIKITSLPYTISHPGQYYLGTNCAYSGASAAIIIEASQVVLNLNGFSIVASGPAKSANVGIGILVVNNEDVTIEGPGDITGFGAFGVLFDASDGKREHNFKNNVYNVAFDQDEIGVLIISGSIDLVEQCDFEGGSVGVYDIASLGGDRVQADNFQAQVATEASNASIGVLSTPGAGILVEDCDVADDVVGLFLQSGQDKYRQNSFMSDKIPHTGGVEEGAGDI
jgi:hypothetical protein